MPLSTHHNIRVLAFTCSRDRLLMLRHCIMQMQRQTYPTDHVVYVNSPHESATDMKLNYDIFLRDLCTNSKTVTKIGYGPSETYHKNYLNSIKLVNIENYDLFLKIDDDDFYLRDYVIEVVRDFEARNWDSSGAMSNGCLVGSKWRPNVMTSLGLGKEDTDLNIPAFMPATAAFSKKGICALLNLEDTGIFEDIQWRRHLAKIPEIRILARTHKNYIYNIHGQNFSKPG